jgi:hypothetical protein
VLAAEQAAQLGALELLGRGLELCSRLGAGRRVSVLLRELEQHARILERSRQPVEASDLALDSALLAQRPLGLLAAVPEVRARHLAFERGEPGAHASTSKRPRARQPARARALRGSPASDESFASLNRVSPSRAAPRERPAIPASPASNAGERHQSVRRSTRTEPAAASSSCRARSKIRVRCRTFRAHR